LNAAPAEHSGIASAVNNDVARTASLIAVAVLPALAGITGDAYLHPAELTQGFHTAMLIGAVAAAAAGLLAAVTIRNPAKRPVEGGKAKDEDAVGGLHCALDAPPLCTVPDRYRARQPGPAGS
ncbi:MAG TPA: hypothetical protein VG253_07405, partial [Streptosporangiaceae bacterium]|nr:hypothetical protein [Streptosporangiaceae bacterium]